MSVVFLIGLFSFQDQFSYYNQVYGEEKSDLIRNLSINEDLTLENLFQRTSNSVVQITIIDPSSGSKQGLGSGFVYDKNGHIITNNHVVPIDQNFQYMVTFPNGNIYDAEVVGNDPFSDLAIIKISNPSPSDLVPLRLGNSSNLKVGNTVVAIGNPFGLAGSLTVGVISGLGRLLPTSEENNDDGSPFAGLPEATFDIPDIIQTDAAINPGNSGGPLLNMKGEVIGVNSAIYSNTGSYAGIGFAIPSDIVKKVAQAIVSTGKYSHPYLGVVGMDLTPSLASIFGLKEAKGFLITDITEGSPASKSDLNKGIITYNNNGELIDAKGDIIVGIDGKQVRKIDDILTHLEKEKKAGESVILSLIRDKKPINIEVTLDARPTPYTLPSMDNNYRECLTTMPKYLCDLL